MNDNEGKTESMKYQKKIPLTHRFGAKFAAFLLVIVFTVTAALGVLGILSMEERDWVYYSDSESVILEECLESVLYNDLWHLHHYLREGRVDAARAYCEAQSIAYVSIVDLEHSEKIWSYTTDVAVENLDYYISDTLQWEEYSYESVEEGSGYKLIETGNGMNHITWNCEIGITKAALAENNHYRIEAKRVSLTYAMRYWSYVICIVSLIMVVVCFVFLMRAAGHVKDSDEICGNWWSKIPFDIFTLVIAGLIFLAVCFTAVWAEEINSIGAAIVFAGCPVLAAEALFVGWCVSLATRLKLKGLWKNTVLYLIIRGIIKLVRRIPFIWKTAVTVALISVVELIALCAGEIENVVVYWFIEKLLLVPAVIYFALMLNRLKRAGKAMAAGDLNYQVCTKGLFLDCREHAENLNSISEGMTIAVGERLKSERMKTELITNVSHDIKTPLTSIINYADLIGRETCDNPKISEYAEVLLRQSERLKKLIEDLVEASKASTGNLEVVMAVCEADMFLSQAAGEYEQRMQQADLELILRQPKERISILADSRRMWRIFDNLMNNICKYAQRGTRVYLTLEAVDGQAVITFKNTSAAALDVSADELMERFVRGDASRNTEGNGLGLSIAKSLTELQKGTFRILIDGDLFKAVLSFPITGKQEAEPYDPQ